jgi:c-di-GMP-binding flagellar brake protein YcgR
MAANELEAIFDSPILRIGMGTTLQFQIGKKGAEFRATAVLVGLVPDEYLIIRVPPIPGILSRLNEGDPMIVRYLYGGNLYGFTSKILTQIYKPTLMLFVAYPEAVETLNLRRTPRVQCCFPATLTRNSRTFRAVVLDISQGGSRVGLDIDEVGAFSFEIDQTVKLRFHLTGVAAPEQVIMGRIKNLKKDALHCEIGIQFDQENEPVLVNIKQFIDNLTVLMHE